MSWLEADHEGTGVQTPGSTSRGKTRSTGFEKVGTGVGPRALNEYVFVRFVQTSADVPLVAFSGES